MKTIIYSCLTNNTFLITQYKSIQKYFTTDYEFIIFDDSREEENIISYNKKQSEDIKNTCLNLNIKYIRIPQELHKNRGKVLPEEYPQQDGEHPYYDHPVTRCALAVQFGFNYIINNYKDCYLFLIDSDMFFINYFNINEYTKDYDLCGIIQSSSEILYLWNGLFICNLSKCKNLELFNWEAGKVFSLDKYNNKTNFCYSTDVGGHNYYYLKKSEYLDSLKNKLKYIKNTHFGTILDNNFDIILDNNLIKFIKDFSYLKSKPLEAPEGWINKELLLDNKIFHIRGGGGWCYHKEEYHKDCIELINNYIN